MQRTQSNLHRRATTLANVNNFCPTIFIYNELSQPYIQTLHRWKLYRESRRLHTRQKFVNTDVWHRNHPNKPSTGKRINNSGVVCNSRHTRRRSRRSLQNFIKKAPEKKRISLQKSATKSQRIVKEKTEGKLEASQHRRMLFNFPLLFDHWAPLLENRNIRQICR